MRRWTASSSNAQGSDRAEQFRSRNQVGDQISGNFLGWEAPGLGWVDFEGAPLLASMASQPDKGARLHFLVKQLSPNIVLQELLPRNLPGAFVLLQQFWSAQNRLETGLAAAWPTGSRQVPDVDSRLAVFRGLLDQHQELQDAYGLLQAALQPINAELTQRGAGRFFVLPWLADRVRGASLLLAPSIAGAAPASQTIFACTHRVLGQMEVHFYSDLESSGWTLHLEQVSAWASVGAWLKQHFPLPGSSLPFAGLRSLPGGVHAGILSRLFLSTEPQRFRLHLRV